MTSPDIKTTVTLIYQGRLPRMNKQSPDWRQRWRLKALALRQFGVWPTAETRRAYLVVTRVLGPRERIMDDDNLRYTCKGLIDALPNRSRAKLGGKWRGGGNWIVDDRPEWMTSEWHQDATRRDKGPRIIIDISYV